MSDLISREYMKSLGATCIASRSKDGTLFPIVAIDELPPADPTYETPSNTLGALDCVSRQAAIDLVESFYKIDKSVLNIMVFKLKQLPYVQPQKGKWIRFGEKNIYYCSRCGAMLEENEVRWRNCYFCYHCGADMRERR